MVIESGVKASLHSHSYHQIICKVWVKGYLSSTLWENYTTFFPGEGHRRRTVSTYRRTVNEPVSVMNKWLLCQISFLTNAWWSRPSLDGHIKNLILYKDDKTSVHGESSMFHVFTFKNLKNHLKHFNQRVI